MSGSWHLPKGSLCGQSLCSSRHADQGLCAEVAGPADLLLARLGILRSCISSVGGGALCGVVAGLGLQNN